MKRPTVRPAVPIDPDMLLRAYAIGVFPMADARDADSVYWVEPRRRAILPLDGFHLSRSLRKTLTSGRFETTLNRDFAGVVAKCAEAAPDRADTWINDQIERAVNELHSQGRAHSIETWQPDDVGGELAGGLYGIALGRAFFGESMFSRATDASKVALAHLVARLRAGGFALLDCQFMTPHLASLGAVEIDRSTYVELLAAAVARATVGSGSGAGGVTDRDGDLGALDLLGDEEREPFASPPSSPVSATVSGPTSAWRIVQSLAHTS